MLSNCHCQEAVTIASYNYGRNSHFFCAKVAAVTLFLPVGVSSDDPSSFSVILFVFLRLLDSIVVVRFGIVFLLLLSNRLSDRL